MPFKFYHVVKKRNNFEKRQFLKVEICKKQVQDEVSLHILYVTIYRSFLGVLFFN